MQAFIRSLTGICLLFFPLPAAADTLIKYQENAAAIHLSGLLDAQISSDKCSVVSLKNGCAIKQILCSESFTDSNYRVIQTSVEQKKRIVKNHPHKMWNGVVELHSGEYFSVVAMRISYSLSNDRFSGKRYPLFKNNHICITDESNCLRKISLKSIRSLQFSHSGRQIEILLTNNKRLRGSFFCQKGLSKRENFQLSGIKADSMTYFEIPLNGLKLICTGEPSLPYFASVPIH